MKKISTKNIDLPPKIKPSTKKATKKPSAKKATKKPSTKKETKKLTEKEIKVINPENGKSVKLQKFKERNKGMFFFDRTGST